MHNRQDNDLTEAPTYAVSKIENIWLSVLKQTDIIIFLKIKAIVINC